MRGQLGSDRRPGATGFDLDEHERPAVEGDDVELSRGEADVPVDDSPGRLLEALCD